MNKMKSMVPANSRGFTLIELLVVVAIIALLVSILLPALEGARMQAETVVCATSLRQLSLSLQMYSYDNNNYVPGGVFQIGPGTWRTWIYFVYQAGYLPGYSDATLGGGAYNCPVGRKDSIYYTYGLNKISFFLGAPYPDDPSGYRKLTTIPNPNKRLWASDSAPTGMGYVISPNEDYGFSPDRHNGVNILYVGGHVEFLAFDDVPTPYPNPLYWAPPYPDPQFWGSLTD